MIKTSLFNKQHLKGLFGEIFVIMFYFITFHRLLYFRYQSKIGEMDLIFRKDKMIIFCEVKTRLGLKLDIDVIANSISFHQRQRLAKSCQNFISKSKRYKDFDYRIDLAIVNSFFRKPFIIKHFL
ncbi:YraN family protein [Candidatus Deianiraea vastatrix]|nr:YraN family protein [Candidatus Deianiraea vastatrix]